MKFSIDEVIGMAWSDKISFEEINKKTGLMEKEKMLLQWLSFYLQMKVHG